MDVTIQGTKEQIRSLKTNGYCVMAQELHRTTIAHWDIGNEFYLTHNSEICYVRIVAKQNEEMPNQKVLNELYTKTFLVCIPSMPPRGALVPK